MNVKLKVCGMKVPANIGEVTTLEPDYMGFILYPGSERFIADLDPAVVQNIPAGIKTTAVFVNEDLEVVKKSIELYGFKAVQLHGTESPAYCLELRGSAEVIKAFGVSADFDFTVLESYADAADYFLFDTQTPKHGGSGKTFSWQLLERYHLIKPYFLSGGIGIDHAAALLQIDDSRLYAIDVNSKFEQVPGLKNISQVRQFKKLLSSGQDCN